MKHSFSLSVFLAFSSLVTVSSESQAQNVPQNILQRINEINITNPSITKEIQFPILRCKNQIARTKIIEDYLKTLSPEIIKMVSDKAAAEAALVVLERELTTAQSDKSAIVAALAIIRTSITMLNSSAAQRIAVSVGRIVQAEADKVVAQNLLAEEENTWQIWNDAGTNDSDLDAAAYRLLNNQTRTARDTEVLGKLALHLTAVDTLKARVLQAENDIAAYRLAKQQEENGTQLAGAPLRLLETQKIEEARVAAVKVERCQQNRNLKEAEGRSLAAGISRLTAVKAPPIHWACNKLVASK